MMYIIIKLSRFIMPLLIGLITSKLIIILGYVFKSTIKGEIIGAIIGVILLLLWNILYNSFKTVDVQLDDKGEI